MAVVQFLLDAQAGLAATDVVPGVNRYEVVKVRTQPTFSVSTPAAFTRGFYDSLGDRARTFDMLADGRLVARFNPAPTTMNVVDPGKKS